MTKGLPTEVDADEAAWKELMDKIKEGGGFESEAAKEIFLERCAESAIEAVLDLEKEQKEALERDEKRRAALEDLANAIRKSSGLMYHETGHGLDNKWDKVCGGCLVEKKLHQLDALTPGSQEESKK